MKYHIKSDVKLYLFPGMVLKTFIQIAADRGTSLHDLLQLSWFQIVGIDAVDLPKYGLLEVFGVYPSKPLLSLLSNKSIADMNISYPVVFNSPNLINKNYNYSLVEFLLTAIAYDTLNVTGNALFILDAYSNGYRLGFNSSIVSDILNATREDVQSRRYLTDVYPLLKRSVNLILNKTASAYYQHTLGLSSRDAMGLLKENLTYVESGRGEVMMSIVELNVKAINESVNALIGRFTNAWRYAFLRSRREHSQIDVATRIKAVVYIASYAPLKMIVQAYEMRNEFVDKLTMYALANEIANVTEGQFKVAFNVSDEGMKVLRKARVEDIKVLMFLADRNLVYEDIPPAQSSGILTALPANLLLLIDTIGDISNRTKIAVENVTLNDVRNVGNYSDNDVNVLLNAMNVSRSYYNESRYVKMSLLSEVISVPLSDVTKFSIIGIIRALCPTGRRFDGRRCISFGGCNSSLCHGNATCTDIIGSYYCRCKNGFSGDGKICRSKYFVYFRFM